MDSLIGLIDCLLGVATKSDCYKKLLSLPKPNSGIGLLVFENLCEILCWQT